MADSDWQLDPVTDDMIVPAGKKVDGVLVGKLMPPMIAHGATGATETFDFSAGPNHSATFDAACTITLTPPLIVGRHCSIELQFSGGAHVLTWPGTVLWAGGSQPTWDTTGKVQVCTLKWNGTNYLGQATPAFS